MKWMIQKEQEDKLSLYYQHYIITTADIWLSAVVVFHRITHCVYNLHYVFMYINNDYCYCLFPFGGGYVYGRLVAAASCNPHNRWFSLGRGRGKLWFKYLIQSKGTGPLPFQLNYNNIIIFIRAATLYSINLSPSLPLNSPTHSLNVSRSLSLHAPDTLLRVRSYVLLSLLILHIITMIIDSNRIMQARQRYN